MENLKAYLRCRIAELEVEEGIKALPPETPYRAQMKMKAGHFETDQNLDLS
jgi:hypothetical protein